MYYSIQCQHSKDRKYKMIRNAQNINAILKHTIFTCARSVSCLSALRPLFIISHIKIQCLYVLTVLFILCTPRVNCCFCLWSCNTRLDRSNCVAFNSTGYKTETKQIDNCVPRDF